MSIAAMIADKGKSYTLQRRSFSKDDAGVENETWTPVTVAVKAWAQPASSSVVERYARRDILITHSCYLTQNLGFQPGDRLELNGKKYAIRGVEDQAGLNRLFCLRLQEQL